MNSTSQFKAIIKAHLEKMAVADKLFAETFKKENKNIDDCINYILNQVKQSGCTGFADEEIFQMAMHYYDEDDIVVGKKAPKCRIVTPQVVSAEVKPKKKVTRKKKAKSVDNSQLSLFV